MSCPAWPGLLEHRFVAGGHEPRGWRPALAHLRGCERCRRRVAALDPSALLAAQPEPEADPGEIESMRRAVAGLRRTREVERRIGRARGTAARWAAAAAVLAALLVPAHLSREPAFEAQRQSLLLDPESVELFRPAPELGAPPLLDALDRPEARVYQLSEEGLSLAIVVDESLDV